MFGFHFAIYGEMLTYGFLKRNPRSFPPTSTIKSVTLHLELTFSLRKINSVRPPNAVRVHSLTFGFFNLVFAKNEILKSLILKILVNVTVLHDFIGLFDF